ncbi:MAG: HutD family protein [Acidocella sp.]|nr:HutD family protein [Acidocella sp.]
MPIHRLKRDAFKPMPWKNGGGETAEIAVFPHGAGLEDFGWRLSMARVAADGPFSCFAGIERTLTVLDGAGFRLTVDGTEHLLTPASAPLRFAGDVLASAALLAGPVTDLNVMTRRGAFRHEVRRVALDIGQHIDASGGFGFLLCKSGSFEALGTNDIISLAADDCLIAEDEAVTLLACEPASAILVSIFPA